MSEEKIELIAILEMLGKPADYAKKVMEQLLEKLGEEKGVEIAKKKMSEPKAIEKSDLFTLFSEVELKLDGFMELLLFMFKYTPSHVEVITPESLKIKNSDLNVFSNELINKLHRYDEIAKAITIENNMLKKQLEEAGIKPVELFQKSDEKKKTEKKKIEKKKD